MGKKAKLKKIRRLANSMPVIQTKVIKGSIIKGEEILASAPAGMDTKVNGEPVKADSIYRKKEIVTQALNHNRKMKKLYNQYGPAGVGMYINAVNRYISSQKAKVGAEKEEAKVEEEI